MTDASDRALPEERRARLAELARRTAGRLTAGLARRLGARHLGLAEDAVHDAFLAAWERWGEGGEPANPEAWLARTARRRALDALRRERVDERLADALERAVAPLERPHGDADAAREELGLFLAVAHPALAPEARAALALHALCGLPVPAIARALLANEDAVAQRLVRARRRIAEEGLDLAVPDDEDEIARRLPAVLDTIELLALEGYAAHDGEELVRVDVQSDALRLAQALTGDARTDVPEARALVARLAFQAARTRARVDARGDLVTLEHQDRSLWDRELVARGFEHFALALRGAPTARHAAAAIEAVHMSARTFAETDWRAILAAYDDLVRLAPGAVAHLNRAVALAHVAGPAAALAELDGAPAAPELGRHALLPAVRAHLLQRLGRTDESAAELRRALSFPLNAPERRLLERRLRAAESASRRDPSRPGGAAGIVDPR